MIITCNPAFMHSINQIFSYNLDDQQAMVELLFPVLYNIILKNIEIKINPYFSGNFRCFFYSCYQVRMLSIIEVLKNTWFL